MDDPKRPEPIPPPLTRNFVSYAGWLLTLTAGVFIVVLILADVLFFGNHPCNSLITYLILPGFLAGGVGLILAGAAWEWRQRHKAAPHEYPLLPTVNLNEPWQRRRIAIGSVLLAVFWGLSAVGSCQACHYTESGAFRGAGSGLAVCRRIVGRHGGANTFIAAPQNGMESLPKTRSGKIMRRVLKARALGQPEGDVSTLEE